MSRHFIYAIFMFVLMAACSNDETVSIEATDTVRIVACMPGADRITRIAIEENNLGYSPKWTTNDKIHTFAGIDMNGTTTGFQDFGEQQIANISSNGKRCEFNVGFGSDFGKEYQTNLDYMGKLVYGSCGKEARLDGNIISIYANLFRTTVAQVVVPVWFELKIKDEIPEAECQYLGTFELLHVTNKSNKEIVFKWEGYDVAEKWYYEYASFLPQTKTVRVNGVPANEDEFPVEPIIAIPAGEERSLIAWYIPTGNKMTDAALTATIDGNRMTSANKKSSTLSINTGHVYHLYANWDGSNLYIDSFVDSGMSFEEVPNHDL